MHSSHSGPRAGPPGAGAHCPPPGPPATLAAVRHGGELPGLAGLSGAARVRELALGEPQTAQVHREDTQRGHCRLQARRAQAPLGVAHVSHVRIV